MITVINAKPGARKSISQKMVKDAIANSPGIESRKNEYWAYMSSEMRNRFRNKPRNAREMTELLTYAHDVIVSTGSNKVDTLFAQMFIYMVSRDMDFSCMFRIKGDARIQSFLSVCASTKFNFNKKEDEELV